MLVAAPAAQASPRTSQAAGRRSPADHLRRRPDRRNRGAEPDRLQAGRRCRPARRGRLDRPHEARPRLVRRAAQGSTAAVGEGDVPPRGLGQRLRGRALERLRELFAATGEEKTIMEFPEGYGYRYKKGDLWILNHMIHNLISEPMKLDIRYTIDFIPDSAPPRRRSSRWSRSGWTWSAAASTRSSTCSRAPAARTASSPIPATTRRLPPRRPQEPLDGRPGRRPALHRRPRPHRRPLHRPLAEPPRRQVRGPQVQHQAAGRGAPRLLGEGAAGQGQPRPPLPLPRQVLRAGRPGLLGRRDEGDAPRLEGPGEGGRHARYPGDLRDQDRLLV